MTACLPLTWTYRDRHSSPAEVQGNIYAEEAEHIHPGKGHSPRYQHALAVDTEGDGLGQLAAVHMGHSTGHGGGSHVAAAADGADGAVDSEAGGSVGADGNSLEPADCCTHFGAGDAARTSYQTFEKSLYGTFRSHVDSAVVGTS